jgi:hypothetical protein
MLHPKHPVGMASKFFKTKLEELRNKQPYFTAEKVSRRNVGPPPADEGGMLAGGSDSRQPR